jgi:hypothetical protein
VPETVEEIVRWLTDHRAALEPLLA